MGAIQKALARGVPVCVVPHGHDHLEVVRRVEVRGAKPAWRLRSAAPGLGQDGAGRRILVGIPGSIRSPPRPGRLRLPASSITTSRPAVVGQQPFGGARASATNEQGRLAPGATSPLGVDDVNRYRDLLMRSPEHQGVQALSSDAIGVSCVPLSAIMWCFGPRFGRHRVEAFYGFGTERVVAGEFD
jgi:hypothetical protein